MVIYANPLEGSKICWNTHLAAQKVAHNEFGHGDHYDNDEDGDNYGDNGDYEDGDCDADDNNISSHEVSLVIIGKPNLFTFYIGGWTPFIKALETFCN